jgi:hypothetical protein
LLERSSKESNCEFHHVLLNSGTEKCFYRRAKVESQHPRTHSPHTSCVGASGGIFLLLLLARIGIEAISKPGQQLIVEIHARSVILLFRSPNHRELIDAVISMRNNSSCHMYIVDSRALHHALLPLSETDGRAMSALGSYGT